MSPTVPRRAALRAVGSAIPVGLAGCVTEPRDPGRESTGTPRPTTESRLSADDVAFDVEVLRGFADDHPARIRTEFTNGSGTPITLVTGATPPFTSYLSRERGDGSRLVLVPEASGDDDSPLRWLGEGEEPVPTTPVDGCWRITREVAVRAIALVVGVEDGETISAEYDTFGYWNDDCLPAGTYGFLDRATLHRGAPPDSREGPGYEVALRFALTVGEDRSPSIEVEEPTVVREE